MAIDWESISSAALSLSALALLWFILRLRQRRLLASTTNPFEYSGEARNPSDLMVPDTDALAELDRLLALRSDSDE
jgi:hypothetical protein